MNEKRARFMTGMDSPMVAACQFCGEPIEQHQQASAVMVTKPDPKTGGYAGHGPFHAE